MDFVRKRRNSNPKKGSHIHYHSPARMFWRTVRGMVPHTQSKGVEALGRLKIFEGVPHPYDEKKRQVIPDALKVLRVKAWRKTTHLGELATSVGWTKAEVVAKLESKRLDKAKVWYAAKTQKAEASAKAGNNSEVKKIEQELAKYGF